MALIHDWLNGMRGGEKVLESLCELFPKAIIYTLFHEPGKVSKVIARHEVRSSLLNHVPGAERYYRHMLPLFPWAIERFDLSGFDLVISSSHCVAKGVKTEPETLHICYCHSPMRYVWDRFDDYFNKESMSPLKYRAIVALAARLRRWDAASSKRVDLFIANSGFVRDRISRYYSRPATVIHPPVDTDFFRPQVEAPNILKWHEDNGGYYLVVSALVPYKRVGDVVEAFRGRDQRLVIVGDGPEKEKLVTMATPNIEFAGWADGSDLLALYRNCRALIFPGVEDFGIVPVEAQACGKPVLALAEGGALETVADPNLGNCQGGEAGASGLFFNQAGPDAIRKAVKKFETMRFDPQAARNNALKFSRQAFQKTVLAFITESYTKFKSDGRAGLETYMISARQEIGQP